MTKLSDTHLVILAEAAQRTDGSVLPLPKSFSDKQASSTAALNSLLKKGMIEEFVAGLEDQSWRQDDTGVRFGLKVTEAALNAIGISDQAEAPQTSSDTPEIKANPRKKQQPKQRVPCKRVQGSAQNRDGKPRRGRAELIRLMERKMGASIDELTRATNWQKHTVRAVISNLRKQGRFIETDRTGETTSYKMVPTPQTTAVAS